MDRNTEIKEKVIDIAPVSTKTTQLLRTWKILPLASLIARAIKNNSLLSSKLKLASWQD